MKKLFIITAITLQFIFYYGCSDDTVSEKKNIITRTSFEKFNDSLAIQIQIQDTTLTNNFADSLNFSVIPKVIYEMKPSNGALDFFLYDNLDSVIFFKRFTGYSWDTIKINYVPIRYVLRITDFAGLGFIKVARQ